jgi:Mn-containing catalase
MFLRIDKLPVELPASPEVDSIAAKNVQELVGGRFGEMCTLNELHVSVVRDARSRNHPALLCFDLRYRC